MHRLGTSRDVQEGRVSEVIVAFGSNGGYWQWQSFRQQKLRSGEAHLRGRTGGGGGGEG